MKIGVLALQGAFIEHINMLKRLNVKAVEVRLPEHLDGLNGLIIPGGESTTLMKLIKEYGLDEAIIEKYKKGIPIYGTCAGAVVLSKKINNYVQPKLGLMDVTIRRNAYGRQIDSFETDLDIEKIGKFRGIFIRAPVIDFTHDGVKTLAKFDNDIVMAEQGHLLVTTFHPELTDDTRVHKYFIDMVRYNRML